MGNLVRQAQDRKGSTLEYWITEASSDVLSGNNTLVTLPNG